MKAICGRLWETRGFLEALRRQVDVVLSRFETRKERENERVRQEARLEVR